MFRRGCVELSQELAFDVFAAGRTRVGVIPDGQFFAGQRHEVAFEDRLGKPQAKVLIHPLVHQRAADVIEVMSEMNECLAEQVLAGTEHVVQLLQLRQPLGFDFDRPVVGAGNAERARRTQRRELDITGADAEARRVLASAAALHRGGYHDRGKRHGDPRIDCRQEHRLGPSPAATRDGDAVRVDLGKACDPVDGPQ